MSNNKADFDPFNSDSKDHLCVGGVTGPTSNNFKQALQSAMDMLQIKIHELEQKSERGAITDSERCYLKDLKIEHHELSDELKNCE